MEKQCEGMGTDVNVCRSFGRGYYRSYLHGQGNIKNEFYKLDVYKRQAKYIR